MPFFWLHAGTNGIGKQTVVELSKHNPAHIYFTGRDEAAAAEVISACNNGEGKSPTFLPCDMTNLSSVRAAAEIGRASCRERV